MAIFQSTASFISDRQAEVYFGPVFYNSSPINCLEMEFKASNYIAVKIIYSFGLEYKERLIHRQLNSHSLADSDMRVWYADITPNTTDRQPFFIKIHVRGVEAEELAVIRKITLHKGNCETTGNLVYWSANAIGRRNIFNNNIAVHV